MYCRYISKENLYNLNPLFIQIKIPFFDNSHFVMSFVYLDRFYHFHLLFIDFTPFVVLRIFNPRSKMVEG